MADNKIFAGPRVRRLRSELKLTQSAMAAELGISPSYLNLVERSQRPLTVQLLLKLAQTYQVDLAAFQVGGREAMLGDLKAVFSDPLLVGEVPGPQEVLEVVEAAPNAATGVIKLYRAYKELETRLSDLSGLLAERGKITESVGSRRPIDEVREVFEGRGNHYPALDSAAEALHAQLPAGDDLRGALRLWLRQTHEVAVRILPVDTMPNWRRRFDRHSRRLFLSERLLPADALREIAMEVVGLHMADALEAEVQSFGFSSAEARRLARFELTRYCAHALMMPYAAFQSAAEKNAYDIDVLAARFQVSFEQAANRLTTLQRQSAPGVPFFMMEVDQAGNRFRRAGAQGFPARRFGGGCTKLSVHAAFLESGRVLVETVELPDGGQFLTIARTLEGLRAGFAERPRRTAVLLACDVSYKDRLVYGALAAAPPVLIGPACKVCERQACLARAEPPLTRPLGLDSWVSGLSAFDF
ncbi:ImmA/IrrE family metallo-endopeptidase [Aureimonas fodinaquatilis]|uniref:ImmA/IrrE family metallo-endopeptidase n=1 Tax=Aureimonas fodinaquatilis TaxID=2565783 RepID=A0A5B0DZ53_9HYPH|nr:XRE family transcriptional regulator [Aureimonas fodinaquatilis]KAA0971813.1 ImmA/IrrE family metallo-endopeptidase [Aureimonas fodinaquatilis]